MIFAILLSSSYLGSLLETMGYSTMILFIVWLIAVAFYFLRIYFNRSEAEVFEITAVETQREYAEEQSELIEESDPSRDLAVSLEEKELLRIEVRMLKDALEESKQKINKLELFSPTTRIVPANLQVSHLAGEENQLKEESLADDAEMERLRIQLRELKDRHANSVSALRLERERSVSKEEFERLEKQLLELTEISQSVDVEKTKAERELASTKAFPA
jgi:hypothetical protein